MPDANNPNGSSHPDFSARDAAPGVSDLFVKRWSPRGLQKGDIDTSTLTRIFDAARWSPSCFNEQPWCFYTSTDDTFDAFLDLLLEGNQTWAKRASIIGFLIGNTKFARNNKPNPSFQLDCGAAWMAMTLQARLEGLYTHGMAGIDYPAVASYLNIDAETEQVLMGFTIGRFADSSVPGESMGAIEAPSARKSLAEIWLQR